MKKIVLASNSKWRKQLLEMAGLSCEVVASNVSEDIEFGNPEEYVMELSKRKAENVKEKISEGTPRYSLTEDVKHSGAA